MTSNIFSFSSADLLSIFKMPFWRKVRVTTNFELTKINIASVAKIIRSFCGCKWSCFYLEHLSEQLMVMFAGYHSTCTDTSNSYILLHFVCTYLVGKNTSTPRVHLVWHIKVPKYVHSETSRARILSIHSSSLPNFNVPGINIRQRFL